MFLFCLVFAMFCARLFICALWSPAGKGLTSWLSFVMYNCDVVIFPLVSWKEESKVANRNWVDHQACSLPQSINVIANLFIMGNYFNELC